MPQQMGINLIKGGIDNIIFYERNGKFFLRKKGNVSRKRVLKDRNFANTRRHAKQLGIASTLASSIYWKLDRDTRNGDLFRKLVGYFKVELAKGKTVEEIKLISGLPYGIGNVEW